MSGLADLKCKDWSVVEMFGLGAIDFGVVQYGLGFGCSWGINVGGGGGYC